MVIKPHKVLCFMFLFTFCALTAHKTQLVGLPRTEELTNRNVLVVHA